MDCVILLFIVIERVALLVVVSIVYVPTSLIWDENLHEGRIVWLCGESTAGIIDFCKWKKVWHSLASSMGSR